MEVGSVQDILMEPLFHNCNIQYKNNTLFFQKWIDAGMTRVLHLLKFERNQHTWKGMCDIVSDVGNYGYLLFEMFQILNANPMQWKNLISLNNATLKIPEINCEIIDNRIKKTY